MTYMLDRTRHEVTVITVNFACECGHSTAIQGVSTPSGDHPHQAYDMALAAHRKHQTR